MPQSTTQIRNGAAMQARASDPTIGVHTLTEFMFCPRAGLIAFERGADDSGQELDQPPSLDYLPDFSVLEIREGLGQMWNSFWWRTLLLFPAGLAVAYANVTAGLQSALATTGVLFPLALFAIGKRLHDIVELYCRLKMADHAIAYEPDPHRMEVQDANWWSMLKAGFTPVTYVDAHHDRDWKLTGKPWRVLVKGSLRIPVFRKRFGEAELFPQHYVRMAAYCHLIEVCEGAESPYGIVLFDGSYDGRTVPNSVLNFEQLKRELKQARRILKSMKRDGIIPSQPQRSGPCQDCPLGRPRIHRRRSSDTWLKDQRLPAFLSRSDDGEPYHSDCGDRYCWVPPHDLAKRKKLL